MTSRSAPHSERGPAWRPLAAALACALFPLLFAANARAQQAEPVELEWTAPAECPQLEDVRASIRKLAGPRKSSSVPLRAEATITRRDDGELHLQLALHAGNMVEERKLDGRSCNALAGATAVAVALLLRSGAIPPESSNPSATTSTETGNQPAGPPDQPAQRADAPSVDSKSAKKTPKGDAGTRSRRWHLVARLPVGLFGVGPVRTASVGVGVAAGVAIDQWRLMLRGAAWLPQDGASAAFQSYTAETHRTNLTLVGCRALFGSGLEVAGCATISLQHLSARGQGPHIAAHTAQRTWAAVGLGGQARLHVASSLKLVFGVEAEVQTARPELFLDGVGSVATLMPAAATVSLGPELIF